MALIALILAPLFAIQRAMYRSPHQRAMDSVNSLDGWAREEADGYVVADPNGGTCPIRDESFRRLIDCQRLRKLTAYQTLLTDAGLQYLQVHKDLRARLIQRAQDVASKLGADVSWRDLMPNEFFYSNVVIGGVTGDVNICGENSKIDSNNRVHMAEPSSGVRQVTVVGATVNSEAKFVERDAREKEA